MFRILKIHIAVHKLWHEKCLVLYIHFRSLFLFRERNFEPCMYGRQPDLFIFHSPDESLKKAIKSNKIPGIEKHRKSEMRHLFAFINF